MTVRWQRDQPGEHFRRGDYVAFTNEGEEPPEPDPPRYGSIGRITGMAVDGQTYFIEWPGRPGHPEGYFPIELRLVARNTEGTA